MPQGTPQPPSALPPRPTGASGASAAHPDSATTASSGAIAEQGTHRLPATRSGSYLSPVGPAAHVEFFEEALTEAVARLRADGGELVTFEPQAQALVLRARVRGNPLIGRGPLGRSSPSRPRDVGRDTGLEEQPTVVLPAAAALRVFPVDAGIRGIAYQRRHPIVLHGDEIDHMVRRDDLPVADATCCVAVPIFRASAAPTLRPEPDVIGVLTLYIRDPMWSFSDADINLLVLHADRVARTLALVEATREHEPRDFPAELRPDVAPDTSPHDDERLRHERSQYEAQLFQFSNAVLTLNASLDPAVTARALVNQAAWFTSSAVRMVFLVDEEAKGLTGVATNWEPEGPHTPFSDVRFSLSWQDLNKLREQQYMVLRPDGTGDTPEERLAAEYQIASCLVLPLERSERLQRDQDETGPLRAASPLLGALFVYTPHQPYREHPKEIQHLQTLVRSASGAMSNATLYRNLHDAHEKQKELDKYKDDFILTVSHEFRTPLTAIEGYTGLISRHGNKLDKAKLDAFAQEIKLAMDQLTGMLGTLADVSRMDNNKLEVSPTAINARAAAEKALSQQMPEWQPRVTIELPEDLWVLADDERLPRIFGNLIGNALKYTEKKPCRVTAHAATREKLIADGHKLKSEAEHWAVIGVRDYGSGISPEDQARLFQKFVRLAHSRTTPIRGTGLGLWICRRYLEALGGAIWVESWMGDGSLFEFCLPVADPPAEA